MSRPNPYFNPKPYIPASLSEINDQLGSIILGAPSFKDRLGDFPDWNIDSEFHKLAEGFSLVCKKLGEERYAALIDLAARAKALFADDQDDTNGKTDQGRFAVRKRGCAAGGMTTTPEGQAARRRWRGHRRRTRTDGGSARLPWTVLPRALAG